MSSKERMSHEAKKTLEIAKVVALVIHKNPSKSDEIIECDHISKLCEILDLSGEEPILGTFDQLKRKYEKFG